MLQISVKSIQQLILKNKDAQTYKHKILIRFKISKRYDFFTKLVAIHFCFLKKVNVYKFKKAFRDCRN